MIYVLPLSCYNYKKLSLYKPVYKNLFLMNKTFTYLVLSFFFFFFFVFVLKPKLNLNLSFCFDIYSKINLVLPLGFKVINVEHLHLKNLKGKVNIFQLINFCNCRIPNKKLYLCNISFL